MANRERRPRHGGSFAHGGVPRDRLTARWRAVRLRLRSSIRRRKEAGSTLLRWAIVAAVVAGAALWLVPRPSPALRVTFLDVGQGDAVLIQAPGNKTALVDAGRGSAAASELRRLGVREIDLLVATHAHADHIGGMDEVLEQYHVRNFMDNGLSYTTQTYERLMKAVEDEPDMTYLRAEPRTLALGNASIEVLQMSKSRSDQNNRSVALVVRYGAFSVLLTGDSEKPQLNFMTSGGMVPDVTVLKAPHHGAASGFTLDLLEAARPEAIVVSVGNNAYSHPSPAAIAAFDSVAAAVLRTDHHGTITVVGRRNGAFEIKQR